MASRKANVAVSQFRKVEKMRIKIGVENDTLEDLLNHLNVAEFKEYAVMTGQIIEEMDKMQVLADEAQWSRATYVQRMMMALNGAGVDHAVP